MILAPFDELNVIREKLEKERAKWDPLTKPPQGLVQDTVDDLMYLLILAYVFGKDHACEDLKMKVDVDEKKMQEAIYEKIDGEDWVARVQKHMEHFDVDMVMVVAETEMNRDFNQGGMDSAALIEKKAGRSVKKTWWTMGDDKVRETHAPLDGVKLDLGDRFYTIDGDSALAPGNFTLPSNNVNCRCTLAFSYG